MNKWLEIDEEITKMGRIIGDTSEIKSILITLNDALLAGVEPTQINNKVRNLTYEKSLGNWEG